MTGIITFTTDFGTDSPYVSQMKAAALSIAPDVQLVDVTHAIRAQDIRQGAWVLAETATRFPPQAVHVAVVDPGVGTARRIICAQFGQRRVIAPDNGLVSRLAMAQPPERVIALTESRFWLDEVSSTFHGRDIMAPAAAHLSLGVDMSQLGPPVVDLVKLDWPEPQRSAGSIQGTVAHIDSFGNVISDIPAALLPPPDECQKLRAECAGGQAEFVRAYGQREPGTLVALVGSGSYVELAVVGGNAAERLKVAVGDPFCVRWTT